METARQSRPDERQASSGGEGMGTVASGGRVRMVYRREAVVSSRVRMLGLSAGSNGYDETAATEAGMGQGRVAIRG